VEQLKKHHFWIICGAMVVIATGVWFLARGAEATKFKKGLSDIQTKKKAAEQILRIANHPNQEFHEGMESKIAARRQQLYDAWKIRWEQQRRGWEGQEEILKWPEQLPRIREKVKTFPPTEQLDPNNPDHKLPFNLRQNYRDFIGSELSKLADIVDSRWAVTGTATAGGEGGVGSVRRRPRETEGQDENLTVTWDPANQQQLQLKLIDRFKQANEVPNTREVLYLQEDIWVLRAVLQIIKETNKDAQEDSKVPVPHIYHIRTGADAIVDSAPIYTPASSGPAAGESEEGPRRAPAPVPPRPGRGGELEAPASEGPDPSDNRYVDKNYELITGAQLRAALDSTNPESDYLAVAKRVPILMKLRIDQRDLPQLLINCGNSPLLVEVRRVRLGDPSGAGRGTSESGTGVRGGVADVKNIDAQQREFPYVDVEVFGIIYLFNKPPEKGTASSSA